MTKIKELFVAREGHVLIVADYDQMELRVAAYLSGDPNMRQVFLDGVDIHASAAAAMYRIDPEDVNDDQRQSGKTQNFAIIYGQGIEGLASTARCSIRRAEEMQANYYDEFSELKPWKRRVIKEAIAQGDKRNPTMRPPAVVIPPFGRKRRLPGLFAHPDIQRGMYNKAVRQAVNALVQGMASNITKLAMLDLHPHLPEFYARMLAQVHDEVVLEVPEDMADDAMGWMESTMSSIADPYTGEPILGEIPLTVSANSGRSWAEAK